jgi:hypothetical protein
MEWIVWEVHAVPSGTAVTVDQLLLVRGPSGNLGVSDISSEFLTTLTTS